MAKRDDEATRRAREVMRRLQHEVRTPISQIMGYAELLEEELEDRGAADLSEDLQKIRKAAARLLDQGAQAVAQREHDADFHSKFIVRNDLPAGSLADLAEGN